MDIVVNNDTQSIGVTDINLGAHNLTVDTNTLFVDSVNHRVGIRTLTPLTELQAASSLTTSPRGIMSSQHNNGTDGSRIHGRKSRGTNAVPLVIVTGDMLARFVGSGFDGTNYLEMGSIDIVSTGTIASTRVPTEIRFNTATDTAPSVLTQRMVIDKLGRVGIGTLTPATRVDIVGIGGGANTPVLYLRDSGNAGYFYGGYEDTGDYGFFGAYKAGTGFVPIALQPEGGNVVIGGTVATNALSFGNAAARKIWIENTATDIVGRILTVGAGSTIAGTAVDNVIGGQLILQGGLGTGTGDSSIAFQTGTTLTTGKTLQTMSTKWLMRGAGALEAAIATAGLVLKQGANGKCGTFTANGTTPVAISNTSIAITDTIVISLNTVGGTVGALPIIATITAATGFTTVATASDTSVYNYAIISNVA